MGEPIGATYKTKNQSIGQREKNSMVLRGKYHETVQIFGENILQ